MKSETPGRSPKLAKVEMDTLQRRRAEHFRVLGAIPELLPRSADTDGRAVGTLHVAELAAQAGVSNKAVGRALEHWRRWRVLWLFWKGGRVWDVRFERSVVDALLVASKVSPRDVGQLLVKHKRQREVAAPMRVPKTLPQDHL
jgi:hypothetical protein